MSTYSDASLIMYPSGYKENKVYCFKPTDGSGDLTFTRASTATRVNESGLIESVATGVPRIDYTGGGCGTLLLEPQRTNLFFPSSNSSTGFTLSNTSFLASQINGLSGTLSGALISETVAASNHYYGLTGGISVTSGTAYTFSVYLKKGNGGTAPDIIQLTFNFGGFGGVYANFNISTGIVTLQSGVVATISEVVNGYYRCSITATATSTNASTGAIIGFANNNPTASRLPSYVGLTTSNFFYDGFQVEVGSYPTSYINTTSTAVTRTQDNATKSGISSLIGQTEGTLFVEFTPTSDINTEVISLVAATATDNVVAIGCGAGYIYGIVYTDPNYRFNSAIAQTIPNNTFKVALCYKNNDFTFFINGVKVASGANSYSPSSPLTRMNFNEALFFGSQVIDYKSVLVFPAKLSDADAIALTA